MPANRQASRSGAAAVTIVGLLAGVLQAAPPAPAPPGTIVLFDGKSLDGWAKTDFANSGAVEVQDGAIILNTGRTMTGITTRRRDLPRTNYELTYEAKRLEGTDFFAAATFAVGKAHLTFVNGGWSGNITGLSCLDGSDASENETSTYYKYKDDTWYRFRVRVTDAVVRCWIDDRQIVDVAIENHELSTRLETRANEPLGFATWDTSGALRKIEVRRLTAEEVAGTKKPAG
jgi:hypothetical protein